MDQASTVLGWRGTRWGLAIGRGMRAELKTCALDDYRNSAQTGYMPRTLKEALSHDYGIPGIRPKWYGPIFILSFGLFLLIVPAWYQLGSNDGLLFLIFAIVTASLSALSTAISRLLKRFRHG